MEGVVVVKKELMEPPCLMAVGELPRVAYTCGYGDGQGGSGGIHAEGGGAHGDGQGLHDGGHGGGGAHDDGSVAHGGGDGECGDGLSIVDEATPPYV